MSSGGTVIKVVSVNTEDVAIVATLVFSVTTGTVEEADSIVERKGEVVGRATMVVKGVVVLVIIL